MARRLFDRLEPIHACTYFAAESQTALAKLGLRGFWMGYFAARSAPLGVVPPDVVRAIFYNFSSEHVGRALPAVWAITTPDAAVRAREVAAVAALHRYGVTDDDAVRVAADILTRVAQSAALDGRPLFAANRALPWPDHPVARLWHATTLLREHRGDGHVAALVSAGVTGRESNLLHSAAGGVSEEFIKLSRRYTDEEWNMLREGLIRRQLLNGDGTLSEAGAQLKLHVETVTDTAALTAFEAVRDDDIDTLFGALTPVTRVVVAGGDIPGDTPMGLRRDDLDNDHA